jgi:hypothetical protein
MIKMLLGNALFAGCVVAWFVYAEWERSLMLSGTILAFGCFLSGIFMGYLLRAPGKRRRVVYSASEQPDDAEDGEQGETESEQELPEPQIVSEPEHREEPEPHVVPVAVPVALVTPVAEPAAPVMLVASPLEPAAPAPERVEILFQNIVPAPARSAAAPINDPEAPLPVHIHEPATKVVVDSDGGYEMVVPSEPAPVIPDEQKK